jgi:hypothetical protein
MRKLTRKPSCKAKRYSIRPEITVPSIRVDSQQAQGAAPLYAQWVGPAANFVITGRNPITLHNYFYNAQCGEVGFEPN